MIATQKPYFFVTFIPQEENNRLAPLTIDPTPDTVIRVLMYFKPLDTAVRVPPLDIVTPERTGFVVVEWGGLGR